MKQEMKAFCDWYKKEVEENDLIDLNFALDADSKGIAEDFAAENNRVNKIIKSGERVARPDVI